MASTPKGWRVPVVAFLLASATFAAFAGVRANGFISLDDPLYVSENETVARGLTAEGWRYAWTSGDAANWHPLTWLSHMIDVELFGLAAGPHHLVNAALHVASTLLLFLLILRWTDRVGGAAFAAGLFGLHPLRVESVAWIAERKDVLSGLFFFLVLHAWTSYVRSGSRRAWVLAFLALLLGLLAKPMLVTLPCLLFVLDFWPFARLERGWRTLVLEKLPLFLLVAVSSAVTYSVQHSGGAVVSREALSLAERAANALASCLRYIGLTAWPAELAVYYPRPAATPTVLATLAAVVLLVVSGWAWGSRRRAPWRLAGWLWYLGLLVPVIGLVQVGQQSHADRYTYLPVIGLVLGLAVELETRVRAPMTRRLLAFAGVVVLGLCAWRTREQVGLWRDTRTLFTHAVAVTRENAMARQNLGNALLREGDIDGAIRELSECVRIVPEFPDAQNGLGVAPGAKRDFASAVRCFETAIATGQDSSHVRTNLGWALLQLGRAEDAERECRKAVELDPEDARARGKLGVVLAATGRTEEAVFEFRRAVELEPASVEHRRALALAWFVSERDAEAAEAYERLLESSPDDVESLKSLAWIRATSWDPVLRDPRAATSHGERAARLAAPTDARLHDVLAAVRAAAGDFDAAVAGATRAAELYRSQSKPAKVAEVEQRLARYRAREPYFRVPPAPK